MLKRLLVAVFALGLFTAFSGTAISGPIGNDETQRVVVPTGNMAKSTVKLDHSNSHPPQAFRSAPRHSVSDFGSPSDAGVDTAGCELQDWTQYATTTGYYAWTIGGGITDQMSMRYDITPSHGVNVQGSRVRVYGVFGAPTLTISVWADNSGIPGALLGSESFVPAVGNGFYYFTTPINVANGPYHVSMGSTSVGADSLWVSSDDGLVGTGRGSYQFAGTWYTNLGAFGPGFDPNWRALSNVCQYYTSCAMVIPDPRGMYIDFLPDGLWSDASVLSGTGQRFKAEGPETLKTIRFRHTTGGAFGDTTNYLDAGTNGLTIKIWGDSSGYARLTPGPIASFGYPGGKANMYPTTGNLAGTQALDIPVPGTPVMLGYYHITVELTSLSAADGTVGFRFGQPGGPGGGMVKFTPPGSGREWDNIAGNALMAGEFYGSLYDGSHSCDIRPTLCKSEFIECKYGTATSCGTLTRIQQASMSPAVGCAVSQYRGWAQRIKGNPLNMIDKVRVMVVADYNSATCASTATATLQVCVWQSVGGAPGPLIAAYPVTPIVSDPGWNEVVIPGGLMVFGDFFIGYNIELFGAGEFMWAGYQRDGDYGVCPPIRDGAWVQTKLTGTPADTWLNRLAAFAVKDNLVAEVDFCAIPIDSRICVTENDWPTLQHDFARSGASGVELSDAYCDLTLNWSRIKPTGRSINFNGPIIWNNHVICAFSGATAGSYEVFNLQTGVTVSSIDDPTWGADNSVIGGNIRCTPTVANVGGVPVLFIVGGNPGSVSAISLAAGFPVSYPGSLLWNYNAVGTIGATRYGNIIVQNIAGTDVVFVVDDLNKVHAINAATGVAYTGWASPYTLAYNSQKAGATDGTNLYYSLLNTAGNGKITAIKMSDGTLAWDFTSLQGATIHAAGGTTVETFEAGVSVDAIAGELFANSRELNGAAQGVFYRLNTSTGAIISAADADRARLTSPTIDAKRVYVPTLPAYTFSGMPFGGNMTAFSRLDGTMDYAGVSFMSGVTANTQQGYRVDGVLSCEPDSADLFYAFNTSGYLSCYNADNGSEVYHRRVDHGGSATLPAPGPSEGGMGALGKDALGNAHLVFVDAYGGLYDMTKGANRARLELLAGASSVAVPFASPADTIVEFPKMYTNTGCVNLVVSLTASTTSNGTTVPAPGMSTIGSRLDQYSSSMADMLSDNSTKLTFVNGKKAYSRDLFGGSTDEVVSFADSRQTYNRSAAAIPAFIIQNAGSYAGDVFDPALGNLTLAPGDTAGIRVHANGPLVNRGPNSFYCEYTLINDPDYYLDNTARRPEVFLSLVGGCLVDTTTLHFGAAGANIQNVYNTLKQGRDGSEGFTIDGNNNEIMYQAFVAYGVDKHRMALNSDKWDGSNNNWISIQADPNYCDNSCKPAISSAVALGAISTDGITYTAISGSVVCQSFIDSVQNHDLGAGWDWDNHAAPFDNALTMGLSANTKVIGVLNAPAVGNGLLLNNMTLNIMTFKERNGVAVPGWKLMAYNDHDMGGRDTAYYDGAHSVGWASPTTGTLGLVTGYIKVPYGCGYSPLKNTTACSQNAISFIPDWDTLWNQATKPAGALALDYTGTSDQGTAWTFDEHDFTASGTHQVGLAYFSFKGLASTNTSTGNIANLATLVNKWSGFGRGDINDDGVINLTDIIRLAENVNYAEAGAVPFAHLGDVDASGGAANLSDVQYLVDYYFNYGPCPKGAFVL